MAAVMKRLLIKDNILLFNIIGACLVGGSTFGFWQSKEYGHAVINAFWFGSILTTTLHHVFNRRHFKLANDCRAIDNTLIKVQHELIVQQDLMIKELKEQANDKG